ncbi:hypothetical protein L3Q82_006307 [Scortum barcoo]|uniref:Uncharacterized protein n=1 Tax=Scortum barcoo TaxID=214431 RepID=A0ACB8X4L2_9TELE|nr:hypothetical protein L3Q82_006307 [Scortum barcoo]
MRKESNMFFLVMSLLYWTQIEGCGRPRVSISNGDGIRLPAGEGFKLSCDFKCLTPRHVAQLWRNNSQESSINLTSTLPSVTLVLSISSATMADTGYYFCQTQPPEAISPQVSIQIESEMLMKDNLTTSNLTTPSTPQCDSTEQHNSAPGIQGQLWYWNLLGKTAILLLSLASLAVKYKRG